MNLCDQYRSISGNTCALSETKNCGNVQVMFGSVWNCERLGEGRSDIAPEPANATMSSGIEGVLTGLLWSCVKAGSECLVFGFAFSNLMCLLYLSTDCVRHISLPESHPDGLLSATNCINVIKCNM